MRWSQLFIPTLRENLPVLQRAGYLRGQARLFLAQRVTAKIAAIARQELDGAQEMSLPGPSALAVANVARELRSYRQLPQLWYQTSAGAIEAFWLDLVARDPAVMFQEIASRCGIVCEAARDGLYCAGGDECLVRAGGYSASLEMAMTEPRPAGPDLPGNLTPEPFHTPDQKTIAEVAAFDGLPDTAHIKSLVMVCDGRPVLALLRGDHTLSEPKLRQVLPAWEVRPATASEILQWFGADPGSLGPIGIAKDIRLIADEALRGRRNLIAGANRNNYHLRHVTPVEDFACTFADLRLAAAGDSIDGTPIAIDEVTAAARWGMIAAPELHVTNESGAEVPVVLTGARLSLETLLERACTSDKDGLLWPASIAPFDVVVTPVNVQEEALRITAEEIYASLQVAGCDTILDDRDERPGVKFKDSDLVGIPWRVTVGKKVPQGLVEVVERRTRTITEVPIAEAAAFLKNK